jgi:hypothetical protein
MIRQLELVRFGIIIWHYIPGFIMKLIFVVSVILGLFEFFAAYEFWFGDDAALLGKHGLLPPVFITDTR